MEQVAVISKQSRPLKIIDGLATPQSQQISMPPAISFAVLSSHLGSTMHSVGDGPARGNTSAQVHYRDASGRLVEYDQDLASALLKIIAGGKQRCLVLEQNSGKFLRFNLDPMEQCVERFVVSGEPVLSDEPPLTVIIEVPWYAELMGNLVSKTEGTMRRKIIVMTAERFRSEEHLNATLPERAHRRTVVRKRADLQSSPGHPAYEEFLNALETTLAACSNGIESFINHTIPGNDWENSRVQMLFKPVERKRWDVKVGKLAFWQSMAAPIAAANAIVYGSAILEIMAYLVIWRQRWWTRRR